MYIKQPVFYHHPGNILIISACPIRCYIRSILILLHLVCYAASVSTRTRNSPGTLSAECFVMEYFHVPSVKFTLWFVLSVKFTLWLRMTPSKRLESGSKVLSICNQDTWGFDDHIKAMIILFFRKESSVCVGYQNGCAAFFLLTISRTAIKALTVKT